MQHVAVLHGFSIYCSLSPKSEDHPQTSLRMEGGLDACGKWKTSV